jgi:hypothetical protein
MTRKPLLAYIADIQRDNADTKDLLERAVAALEDTGNLTDKERKNLVEDLTIASQELF